jgi:hypothetical protein
MASHAGNGGSALPAAANVVGNAFADSLGLSLAS